MAEKLEKHFTRKYRPIQLGDVIGQDKVVKALSKQAEKGLLSQAFLFAGHWGAGKTTIARIVAKMLTCPHAKGARPCGTCRSCVAIHNGYCPDVAEINAASTRGIDKARDIRSDAMVAPQELSRKVYILDEAHQLTDAAWNALLKVIEEPPPYVNFIFCTTEHRKVPTTIMSRCRRYFFRGITREEAKFRLKQVCDREKIKIDDEALSFLARASRGSMRDAFELLEDIAIVTDNNVTAATVHEYFGAPEDRTVYALAKKMVDGDIPGIMHDIDDIIMACVDVRIVASELNSVFRNAFVLNTCGKDSPLLDVESEDKSVLEYISDKLKRQGLLKVAQVLGRLDKELDGNVEERWIMETALIGCVLSFGK